MTDARFVSVFRNHVAVSPETMNVGGLEMQPQFPHLPILPQRNAPLALCDACVSQFRDALQYLRGIAVLTEQLVIRGQNVDF